MFRDYDIEIEGLKRETLKAQEEHEGLVAIRDRHESDRAFVEEQLAKTKVPLGEDYIGIGAGRDGNRTRALYLQFCVFSSLRGRQLSLAFGLCFVI